MKRNIQMFAFLLCLLLTATHAFAAPEAEYKQLAKTWTLHADGSQEFRYSMELTLFTHTAMNSTYGESFIVYNPQYQKLKINASYTRQKDGTIIRTPDNAFVEVLPHAAADAPAYNHLKEMVVVHTGLELGATIYLDYTISSQAGYLPEIDLFEELLQSSPVKECTLSIRTPVGKPLTYTLSGSKARAKVSEEDGVQTTTWTLRNLPAASRAPFVSVSNGDVPYLAATTYASEEAALATLYKQFGSADDLQLATLAESITEGKTDNPAKLQAILAFVRENIANSPLKLEETGYRLRPAADVLSSAYGTAAEKANLLIGLLNGAGFKLMTQPMATYRVSADKGLALKAIDRLYAYCSVDGEGYYFALPDASTRRPQVSTFNHTPLYSLQTGKPVAVPLPAAEEYGIRGEYKIAFNEGNVTTEATETAGAALIPYFAEGERKSHSAAPLKVVGGYATLQLPESAYAFSRLPYGNLNSRRKENLMLPHPVSESYTYTVECPEQMELRTPETDKTIRNVAGSLTISIQKKGHTATVSRSLILSKQLYTPAEYDALRQLLTEWSDANQKTLLFSVQ